MNIVRIKGANLNKEELLLYKEITGDTVSIPINDRRVKPIMDEITPILLAGGVATIDLDKHPNDYALFEKKSNGLVRFFKVAKAAVAHLFSSDADRQDAAEKILGDTSTPENQVAQKAAQVNVAASEILANAVSVSDSQKSSDIRKADETIVAVVGTGENTKIVPGIEQLADQVSHSVNHGSTIGMTRLIERLGAVIDKRGHSVQDVIRFLNRSDLPIADDGSIIAYKILKYRDIRSGIFVDCHTGRIPQKVGSIVRVEEHLVDRDRRNECSNGLHIARRGYLGNFRGDVCVLIKLEPENIITVPHNDPDKVRVTAYQILGVIPPNEFALLKKNQPMTASSECQQLLAAAINGTYSRAIEEVLVTEQAGKSFTVTPLEKSTVQPKKAEKPAQNESAMPPVALDDQKAKANRAVNLREVNKQVQEKSGESSRKLLAKELKDKALDVKLELQKRKDAAQALIDMKRRTKVAWSVLGVSETEVSLITKVLAPEKNAAPKAVKLKVEAKKQEPLPLNIKLPTPEVKISETKAPKQTLDQKVVELLKVIMNGHTVEGRINAARQLVELKKTNRKSWAGLHVSDKEVEQIQLLTAPVKSGTVHDVKEAKPKQEPKKQAVQATKPVAPKTKSNKDYAQELYKIMLVENNTRNTRRKASEQLLALKKKAKVGYAELGLNKADVEALIKKLS